MIHKKKVLYFMPDPPLRKDHGCRTRALQFLEYFDSRPAFFDVDFVSIKEVAGWDQYDDRAFKHRFPNYGLYVGTIQMPRKNKLRYYFKWKLPNLVRRQKLLSKGSPIQDLTNSYLQNQFNQILQKKKYDVIIISYVTWANLVCNNPYLNGAKLIIDTHDFMTVQFKEQNGFKLGAAFEREIKLLSMFDEIWSISMDEYYLFSQFLQSKHRFVPVMFSQVNESFKVLRDGKKYDLIYVASDNPNNIRSANWFFKQVYPSLPKELKICVIGLISKYVPDYCNVEKHSFVEELHDYYNNASIAICPMLGGTGIKVKVVEAMSYGLPVVCNLRGLDGIPLKFDNGCIRADTPEDFASEIVKLARDIQYRGSIASQSKALFNRFFTIKKGYENLDSIFELPKHISSFNENVSPVVPKRVLDKATM
ncbi:glycosyltransferase family 4 protein [Niabella sp. CC-SYL272]|uniref:glycosyltransferase n=1 Tax=Niabella agricola TaxID=2891571 RepID=UPI001F2D23AB|nr:glycosyltransferase [Niabella agricola]MCF3109479.1 glycosyltransferase family 4 protein [Niabella agricola]